MIKSPVVYPVSHQPKLKTWMLNPRMLKKNGRRIRQRQNHQVLVNRQRVILKLRVLLKNSQRAPQRAKLLQKNPKIIFGVKAAN